MSQRAVPRSSVCADWAIESDAVVLRFQAVNLRKAWSNGLIWISLMIGLVSGGLVFLSNQDVPGAMLTVILCATLIATVVGYMRMGLNKREMEIRLTQLTLCIDDGADRTEIPVGDLRRLLIVHDGAPAQIRIDAPGVRFRCTIGQLYRHNRVERFVAEVPASARNWLEEAGLTCSEMRKRGVLRSDFQVARFNL